jgi:hypothetical protein
MSSFDIAKNILNISWFHEYLWYLPRFNLSFSHNICNIIKFDWLYLKIYREISCWNVISNMNIKIFLFLKNYTSQHKYNIDAHNTHTKSQSYPYEHLTKIKHPAPRLSTHQIWIVPKLPLAPRCRREHRLPLNTGNLEKISWNGANTRIWTLVDRVPHEFASNFPL